MDRDEMTWKRALWPDDVTKIKWSRFWIICRLVDDNRTIVIVLWWVHYISLNFCGLVTDEMVLKLTSEETYRCAKLCIFLLTAGWQRTKVSGRAERVKVNIRVVTLKGVYICPKAMSQRKINLIFTTKKDGRRIKADILSLMGANRKAIIEVE